MWKPKCVYCGKEVNTDYYNGDCEYFGCDGDYIHKRCRQPKEEEMDAVLKMDDKEFYEYMQWKRGK